MATFLKQIQLLPVDIKVGIFIIVLHLAGAIGYLIDSLNGYFLLLTPVNLLIVGLIVVYFQFSQAVNKLWMPVVVIFIGIFAEVIGVKYGFLFGSYEYGETLGPKVMGVPWMIGMNWLQLGFAFAAVATSFLPAKKIISIPLAAALMVLLDVLIEPVAIKYDYWSWENGTVPIMNYIGWFIVANIVQILIQQVSLVRLKRLSWFIISGQLLFFTLLNLF
ncbi:MAG: carotenoid biosynthesis protein [Bacteroidota bacterium]